MRIWPRCAVPRNSKTFWKIDTSSSEVREGAEESKKNVIYRSTNFWLKTPISCYKQHFVFLNSANEWRILQKLIYVFCWTYFTRVSFVWFFYVSRLTTLHLRSSLGNNVWQLSSSLSVGTRITALRHISLEGSIQKQRWLRGRNRKIYGVVILENLPQHYNLT